MKNISLTRTQLKWIVTALQHEITGIRDEMDKAEDGSPIVSIGEVMMEGRKNLVNQLNDIIFNEQKTIRIK